ncbi:MAG: hypothetical protein ACI9U2_004837 [Bradymonadia bacterium]|jgi:hypothetical protein
MWAILLTIVAGLLVLVATPRNYRSANAAPAPAMTASMNVSPSTAAPLVPLFEIPPSAPITAAPMPTVP